MVARWKSAERERVSALSMVGRGAERPVRESTDHGGDQAVTLADGAGQDVPGAALAVASADGVQDALTLHLNHESVNRALVLAGVESHALHDLRAGLGTVLNQSGADCGADDGAEVHRCGVVN